MATAIHLCFVLRTPATAPAGGAVSELVLNGREIMVRVGVGSTGELAIPILSALNATHAEIWTRGTGRRVEAVAGDTPLSARLAKALGTAVFATISCPLPSSLPCSFAIRMPIDGDYGLRSVSGIAKEPALGESPLCFWVVPLHNNPYATPDFTTTDVRALGGSRLDATPQAITI